MQLCDIGFNLCEEYHGIYRGTKRHEPDLNKIMQRASDVGVKQCILTGVTLKGSRESLQMCRENSINEGKGSNENDGTNTMGFYCTVGVHPSHSKDFHKNKNLIHDLESLIQDGIRDKKVVALGELGLDYDRLHYSSKEDQMFGFLSQLELSKRLEHPLPLFLHDRNTGGDLFRVLEDNRDSFRKGGVVHSFTGTVNDLEKIIELGLYVSINGCSLRTEESLEIVKNIPEELLLLETDAPYCSIKPTHPSYKHVKTFFPTKKVEKYDPDFLVKDRNEPCTIVQVLEVLAAVREQNPLELSERIFQNTQNLFFREIN